MAHALTSGAPQRCPVCDMPCENGCKVPASEGRSNHQAALYEAAKDLHDYLWANVPDIIEVSTSSELAGEGVKRRLQALKEALRNAPAEGKLPNSTQLQRGVEAYQEWEFNTGNENSSAYGGNITDLASRIYLAMVNS